MIVQGGLDANHPSEPPHTIGLAGSNSYSGTTTVTNFNILTAGSTENLGDGSPTNYLILDNGTFQATGNISSSRRVNVTALGGTIDTGTFDVGFGVVDSGTFTKVGGGTLTVTRLDTVPMVNVNAGLLKVAPNGTSTGVSKIGNLTLAGGTSLDITNNRLIVTGSDLLSVRSKIIGGYASGSWTGAGITSSTAAAIAADGTNPHKTALGYATASDLGVSTFGGPSISVNPTDVLVRYVYTGDANLDGVVNALDFNAVATNFGTPTTLWTHGDFNLDGTVNTQDFTLLGTNFNQALPNPAPSLLSTLVPEPVSMFALVLRRIGLCPSQALIRQKESKGVIMETKSEFRRGFTLVELLVVIGIIAVLIGVLLPALQKAKEAGQIIACASRMRQIGMAMQMYVNDWKGTYPPCWIQDNIAAATAQYQGQLGHNRSYVTLLRKYLGRPNDDPYKGGNSQVGGNMDVFRCPNDILDRATWLDGGPLSYTMPSSWGPDDIYYNQRYNGFSNAPGKGSTLNRGLGQMWARNNRQLIPHVGQNQHGASVVKGARLG